MTVPSELADYMKQRVEAGEFESVSAFVTRAGEAMRDFEPLDLFIASMVAETGEPDEGARAWAEEAIARARRVRRGG
ncbi:MAG: hypothetical protein ACRDN9_04565 [Streptosporangiaceae bacterium]